LIHKNQVRKYTNK